MKLEKTKTTFHPASPSLSNFIKYSVLSCHCRQRWQAVTLLIAIQHLSITLSVTDNSVLPYLKFMTPSGLKGQSVWELTVRCYTYTSTEPRPNCAALRSTAASHLGAAMRWVAAVWKKPLPERAWKMTCGISLDCWRKKGLFPWMSNDLVVSVTRKPPSI